MECIEAVGVCTCAGASVIATGQLVASPGSKQAVEIKADKLTLIGACDAETFPLQKVRQAACGAPLYGSARTVPHVGTLHTPQLEQPSQPVTRLCTAVAAGCAQRWLPATWCGTLRTQQLVLAQPIGAQLTRLQLWWCASGKQCCPFCLVRTAVLM